MGFKFQRFYEKRGTAVRGAEQAAGIMRGESAAIATVFALSLQLDKFKF